MILCIKISIFPIFPPDLTPSPPDPVYTSYLSSNFHIPCSFSSNIPWSIVNNTGVTGGSWSFAPLNDFESSSTLLELQTNPSFAWKIPSGKQSSLMETDLKNHVLDVKISRVSTKDRGNYTCSLGFRSGALSRHVQVEVLQGECGPMKN